MPASIIIRTKNGIANSDDTLAPLYKPRYVSEDTREIPSNFQSWDRGSIISYICSSLFSLFKLICCGSRRRVLMTILLGVLVCLFNISIIDSIYSKFGGESSYSMASRQSYHFFQNIPQHRWQLLQKRTQKIRSKQMKHKKNYKDANKFYQHNFPQEFTCPHEERIGGTKSQGSMWLCNPRSILNVGKMRSKNNGNGCTAYVSLANINNFQFEKDLLGNLPDCALHVFSPVIPHVDIPDGVIFHQWGFKGSSDALNTDPNYKTIYDTIKSLKHELYTIDVLAIDCQGCEHDLVHDLVAGDQYKDAPVFMQILVQIHDVDSNFFHTLQNHGYVSFHKSPSAESNSDYDYGFLKLSPEFFVNT